ncbi:MAG: hypothetical protein SPI77_09035 [Corynebacterium sp.]|nr:hypothetical protein [Corynebacterium sp.]
MDTTVTSDEVSIERRRLLEQAAIIVSKTSLLQLNLEALATSAEVTVADLRSEFGDEAGLIQALKRFLISRFHYFINAELAKLDPAASPADRLNAASLGYFAFAQSESQNYGAYIKLPMDYRKLTDFDAELPDDVDEPSLNLFTRLTRDVIVAGGGEKDTTALAIKALGVFSTVQGVSHLATIGILRHLSPAAKRQTVRGVFSTIWSGVKTSLVRGARSFYPEAFRGDAIYNPVPQAKELARGNDEQKVEAIFRGAIDAYAHGGLEAITVERGAEFAGMAHSEAAALIDGDARLLQQLETYLDNRDQAMIGSQCFVLPEEHQNAINFVKATGFGYVAFAVNDPIGFDALIAMASGSIVPSSFDVNSDDFDMGVAFSFLLDLARNAIQESGSQESSWNLYTVAIAVWAAGHGLAVLLSVGALRNLPIEEKIAIMSPVLDVVVEGLIVQLGITDVKN